jgi:hypothetical protein
MASSKLSILVGLLLVHTISCAGTVTFRSPDPTLPSEFLISTASHDANLSVRADSNFVLTVNDEQKIIYKDDVGTLSLLGDVINGGNIQTQGTQYGIYFQDQKQWALIHQDDFEEEPEHWSESSVSRCGISHNQFLGKLSTHICKIE